MTNLHTLIGAVRDAHAIAKDLSERVLQSQAALSNATKAHQTLVAEFRAAEHALCRAKNAVQGEWSALHLELEDETPEPEVRKWVGDMLYDSTGRWVANVRPTGNNHHAAFVGERCLGEYLSRSAAVAAVEKSFEPTRYSGSWGVTR